MKQVAKYILIVVVCVIVGWKLGLMTANWIIKNPRKPETLNQKIDAVIRRRQAAARRYS